MDVKTGWRTPDLCVDCQGRRSPSSGGRCKICYEANRRGERPFFTINTLTLMRDELASATQELRALEDNYARVRLRKEHLGRRVEAGKMLLSAYHPSVPSRGRLP